MKKLEGEVVQKYEYLFCVTLVVKTVRTIFCVSLEFVNYFENGTNQ